MHLGAGEGRAPVTYVPIGKIHAARIARERANGLCQRWAWRHGHGARISRPGLRAPFDRLPTLDEYEAAEEAKGGGAPNEQEGIGVMRYADLWMAMKR
jgi:hypothetical protein